jgi:hypothetical protein
MLAFEDILSPEGLYLVWLAAFGVALALTLAGLMCHVCRGGRVSRASWGLWSLASLVVAAICVADTCRRFDEALEGPAALVAKGALMSVLGLAGYLIARGHLAQGRRAQGRRAQGPLAEPTAGAQPVAASPSRRLSWALLVGNAVATVWAWICFYNAVEAGDIWQPVLPSPTRWVAIVGAEGITDRGSSIELLRTDGSIDDVSLAALFGERFRERVIEVAGRDDRANCHGWVFAAGRYAISGQNVDTILKDNQYERVEQPGAGDLIVYRDGAGKVLHSGVVRLAEGDLMLVESKWGSGARYLHKPSDQAYSLHYEFYRSPRSGHHIALADGLLAGVWSAPSATPKELLADAALSGTVASSLATPRVAEPSLLELSGLEPNILEPSSLELSLLEPGIVLAPGVLESSRAEVVEPRVLDPRIVEARIVEARIVESRVPRVAQHAAPAPCRSCSGKPAAAGPRASKLAFKDPGSRAKLNPLWWPKRPPILSYKPFPWYAPGVTPWWNPSAPYGYPMNPGPTKKQSRG